MSVSKDKIIDTLLPIIDKVTNKTREHTRKESSRFRGSVRVSCGNFFTDEEYEAYREKVLNTELP